jgi:hypothetical protein
MQPMANGFVMGGAKQQQQQQSTVSPVATTGGRVNWAAKYQRN